MILTFLSCLYLSDARSWTLTALVHTTLSATKKYFPSVMYYQAPEYQTTKQQASDKAYNGKPP